MAMTEPIDFVDTIADAHGTLAEVYGAAGRLDDALEQLRRVLAIFEAKGNVVMAARTRDRIDALGSS